MGEVASFLGLNGETVISVAASVVCARDENLYEKVKLDSVTKYMKKGWGSTQYLANYAKSGDGQFRAFYNYGESSFIDGLPNAKLVTAGLSEARLKTFLNNLFPGVDSIAEYSISLNPEEGDWVRYQLQELYHYDYDSNLVIVNSNYYIYDSSAYDTSNNVYNVTLKPITQKQTTVYETVTKTIETHSSYDIQRVLTTQRTVVTLIPSYYVLSDTTVEVSNTSTQIPVGTGEESENMSEISSTTDSTGVTANETVTVPAYTEDGMFLSVRYIKDGKSYLWIYDGSTNQYPILHTFANIEENIKVYPVIMIRNWNKNINDFGDTEHDTASLDAYVQAHPNEADRVERYKNTKEFLNRISVDLDDVTEKISENSDLGNVRHIFFGFGLMPREKDEDGNIKLAGEAVSKALWNTFDYLYSFIPNIEPLKRVDFDIVEGDYNIYCRWRALPPVIEERVIGKIGTCKHRIKDANYVRVKQHVRETELISEKCPNTGMYNFGYKHVKEYWAIRIYTNNYTTYEYNESLDSYDTVFHYGDVFYEQIISSINEYDVCDMGEYVTSIDPISGDPTSSFEAKYKLGTSTINEGRNSYNTDNIQYHHGFDDWDVNVDGGPVGDGDIRQIDKELVMEKQIDATHVKVYKTYRNRNVYIISREDGDDGCSDKLLYQDEYAFPLLYETVNRLGVVEKTQLIGYVMDFTFFAYQKTHLEWYETEGFMMTMRAFTIIATMAITFVSLGSLTPAALASMTTTELLTSVATNVAIAGALYFSLQLISSLNIGVEFKMLAAAAAVVIAAYAGGAFDEFNGTTITALLEIPSAACDMYTKDLANKMSSLQKEQRQFTENYQERMQSFDKAWQSINAGLSTESATSLATMSESTEIASGQAYSWSPSMLYAMGTTAYLNTDMVFSGLYRTVSDFCSNKLRIGVLGDDSSQGE